MEYNTIIYDKNTPLYRGSANRSQNIVKQMWFTPDVEAAKIYGYVYKYKVTKPVVLLKMDDPSNILKLTEKAARLGKNDVVDALSESFRIVDGKILRDSEAAEDKIILNFICSLGLAGFISSPLRKDEASTSFFHAEVGLCDARGLVEQLGPVATTPRADVHAFRMKEARVEARKRHRAHQYDNDDDDDYYDDDDDYKPRKLF